MKHGLRRFMIYATVLALIAGYGLISGAEHATQYKLKQSALIKEMTQ